MVSCGKLSPKGDITLQSVSVEPFTTIVAEGNFRIFWLNSVSNKVDVETYPNIYENLNIAVKNGTLTISEKRKTDKVDFYNLTIYSQKNLDAIKLSDSVEFNVSGELNTDNLHMQLKNNAKFIGAVRTKNVNLEMSEKSLANFRGFSDDVSLSIKDTANILSTFWKIDKLKIDAKNGTYTELYISDDLEGKVTNTSKLIYYGNPTKKIKMQEKASIENKNLN